MTKKVIAVDIDDVLAVHVDALLEFSNKTWGTNLTLDDYDEHWGVMWKLEHDIKTTEKRAHTFFDSGAFSRLRHFTEAIPVLKTLKSSYKLILITSRRQRLLEETTQWINAFFPGIFEETHYAGIWEDTKDNRHTATKADLCKELKVEYLIDDQLKHCLAAAEIDVQSLLFGNYKWNQAKKLPKNVVRVTDWQAVKEFFDAAG